MRVSISKKGKVIKILVISRLKRANDAVEKEGTKKGKPIKANLMYFSCGPESESLREY